MAANDTISERIRRLAESSETFDDQRLEYDQLCQQINDHCEKTGNYAEELAYLCEQQNSSEKLDQLKRNNGWALLFLRAYQHRSNKALRRRKETERLGEGISAQWGHQTVEAQGWAGAGRDRTATLHSCASVCNFTQFRDIRNSLYLRLHESSILSNTRRQFGDNKVLVLTNQILKPPHKVAFGATTIELQEELSPERRELAREWSKDRHGEIVTKMLREAGIYKRRKSEWLKHLLKLNGQGLLERRYSTKILAEKRRYLETLTNRQATEYLNNEVGLHFQPHSAGGSSVDSDSTLVDEENNALFKHVSQEGILLENTLAVHEIHPASVRSLSREASPSEDCVSLNGLGDLSQDSRESMDDGSEEDFEEDGASSQACDASRADVSSITSLRDESDTNAAVEMCVELEQSEHQLNRPPSPDASRNAESGSHTPLSCQQANSADLQLRNAKYSNTRPADGHCARETQFFPPSSSAPQSSEHSESRISSPWPFGSPGLYSEVPTETSDQLVHFSEDAADSTLQFFNASSTAHANCSKKFPARPQTNVSSCAASAVLRHRRVTVRRGVPSSRRSCYALHQCTKARWRERLNLSRNPHARVLMFSRGQRYVNSQSTSVVDFTTLREFQLYKKISGAAPWKILRGDPMGKQLAFDLANVELRQPTVFEEHFKDSYCHAKLTACLQTYNRNVKLNVWKADGPLRQISVCDFLYDMQLQEGAVALNVPVSQVLDHSSLHHHPRFQSIDYARANEQSPGASQLACGLRDRIVLGYQGASLPPHLDRSGARLYRNLYGKSEFKFVRLTDLTGAELDAFHRHPGHWQFPARCQVERVVLQESQVLYVPPFFMESVCFVASSAFVVSCTFDEDCSLDTGLYLNMVRRFSDQCFLQPRPPPGLERFLDTVATTTSRMIDESHGKGLGSKDSSRAKHRVHRALEDAAYPFPKRQCR